jgi:hypothetical protein
MPSEEPCRHCGAHRVAHEPARRRGHDYEPTSWPLIASCANCGREARLWPDGLVCPVCSGVMEAIWWADATSDP